MSENKVDLPARLQELLAQRTNISAEIEAIRTQIVREAEQAQARVKALDDILGVCHTPSVPTPPQGANALRAEIVRMAEESAEEAFDDLDEEFRGLTASRFVDELSALRARSVERRRRRAQ